MSHYLVTCIQPLLSILMIILLENTRSFVAITIKKERIGNTPSVLVITLNNQVNQ